MKQSRFDIDTFDQENNHDKKEEDGDYEQGEMNQSGINTGRWTRQEHEIFQEALKKYGKEWKNIANMVKTRTIIQVRTHAQVR
jgi:SHAQKYF class myb-like DNA-binding protein